MTPGPARAETVTMLEFIRKYAQGLIAWVIFGMLIVAFALWGIQSYFSPGAPNDVVKVNGEEITTGELATAIELYQARLRALFGKNYDPGMFSKDMVKANVLKSLIDQSVLSQAAQKAGFRISDAQLGAEIRARKEFQRNGAFSEKQYQQLLRNQGMSMGRFEHNMRRAMLIDQVNAGITRTAFVTERQLHALLDLKNQQRDFGYMIVSAKRFMDRVEVSDKEIRQRYERDPSRFKVPAKVSVNYLELSVSDLAKDIKPTEQDLHKYYQDHLADFGTEETRHASHILIAVPEGAGAKAVAAARVKAQDILKKIHQGVPFAELAKKYSDDPGSAKQGGDLGFFGRGDMAPAFEKAVFSLKPGQVSGVVRTSFGFHIIKLLGIRPGKTKSFDQVRDQIAKDYRHDKAEDRFYDLSEKLENLTYEHPNSLQSAADALGLAIKSTGLFTRDNAMGNDIAASPEVRKAAFGDDVLNNNYNSLPVHLSRDRTIVLRKKAYQAPSVQPLNAVQEEIRSEIKRDKAGDMAKALADKLAKSLRGGADPEKLAKDNRLTWQRSGLVSRDDKKVDLTLLRDVFKQPKPGAKPLFGDSTLAQGNYAVYALYAVKPGAAAGMKAAAIKSFEESQASGAGEMEYRMMLESLRDHADIKVNKKNL